MSFIELAKSLESHPVLREITLDGVTTLTRLISHLKRDILQPQPAALTNIDVPPLILPQSVKLFLSHCVGVPLNAIDDLWSTIKDYTWSLPTVALTAADAELFKHYGWQHGLTKMSLYPPSIHCINPSCGRVEPLKEERQQPAIIYTTSDGAQPAYNVHPFCSGCNTSYHNGYSVRNNVRTYYDGIPKYIQVAEHQFIETTLVNRWRTDMLVAWMSASNMCREYESALTDHNYFMAYEWKLKPRLRPEHVWDAIVIYSLLEDRMRRGFSLEVPHTGEQSDRFVAAMEERNQHIIEEGQPDAVRHACDRCMRVYDHPDGTKQKCQAIVADGISIGRPCCGVFKCQEPLRNNRHRFCASHDNLHCVCAIVGCNNPVVEFKTIDANGKETIKQMKTCALLEHQKMEKKQKERAGASFLLQECLRQARVGQLNNSAPNDNTVDPNDVEPHFSMFEIPEDGTEPSILQGRADALGGTEDTVDEEVLGDDCPSKSGAGNRKFKAMFGRHRTHNEQTLVRPCGVIYARGTMYGAEAISNYLVMLKNAFSVPGACRPEHTFYDSNCLARQQAEKDDWFKDIGMCVDVWHFRNKHSVRHEYCQTHCNPSDYPELIGENGGWYFNTSVAEQTNAWLGGYLSICREMLPAKYDFFLDEMIRLRNIDMIRSLKESGANPWEY